MKFTLPLACAVAALPYLVAAYDEKIYGVNLGSWCASLVIRFGVVDAHALLRLVLEPWMSPAGMYALALSKISS